MDTSEQYVKLCEKTTEIQKGWQPKGGDWCSYIVEPCSLDDPCYGHYTEKRIGIYTFEHPVPDGAIWLPRQDQLQKMVKVHHDCTYHDTRIAFFNWYMRKWNTDILCQLWTDEQLWFAFVMDEIYGKQWINENWREI